MQLEKCGKAVGKFIGRRPGGPGDEDGQCHVGHASCRILGRLNSECRLADYSMWLASVAQSEAERRGEERHEIEVAHPVHLLHLLYLLYLLSRHIKYSLWVGWLVGCWGSLSGSSCSSNHRAT